MSLTDDFISSHAEISSSASSGITSHNKKGLIVMYFFLIIFILGWTLYLFTKLSLGSGSFDDSKNHRGDVMDWK